MRSPVPTSLRAVLAAELLFNSRRAVPYALMILFSGNAVLWWIGGPAISRHWATNSDFYIARLFGAFSFMTMPLFVALVMADPVIRDFRIGIDPLIFSKPLEKADYLLGKFLGNFVVLIACEAAFALTLFLLQLVPTRAMVVLPFTVAPYFEHFVLLVGVSSLGLAAVCFTVGTLTRNVKVVYGVVTSSYVIYILYQVFVLKPFPQRWRVALDPLLFNLNAELNTGHTAEWLNHYVLRYTFAMIANRGTIVLLTGACLAVLHLSFRGADRTAPKKIQRIANPLAADTALLPAASNRTTAIRNAFTSLVAATQTDFRLLLAERSLVVVFPLAAIVPALTVAVYGVASIPSYSAAYAARIAESLLLFIVAIAIFFVGEAMHRDREVKIEPLLWSSPIPNVALLLSRFLTTVTLSATVSAGASIIAIAVQLAKRNGPLELSSYLRMYALILLPSIVFVTAAAILLNVILRDKHAALAVCLAVAGGLFYLYSLGYNHWIYNPTLYGLWTPSDLLNGSRILGLRTYCLALTIASLSAAHLFFERKTGTTK